MVDRIYKIGDFVKIIKPKHFCFGNIGRVLKINKNSLIISGDDNCDEEIITISKKYVEFQEKVLLSKMKMIPLTKGGKKKQGLDYYIKKVLIPEDFEDFVLFNYMRTYNIRSNVSGKYITTSKSNLLKTKIRERKIKGSSHQSCVFFTPIPIKFFAKYFSEELIERYSENKTDVFICLDSKVLCNIPKNYWIGVNKGWNQGPKNLINPNTEKNNTFYALDKCDTKPEMNKSFLDFITEQLITILEDELLEILEDDIGLTIYLEEKNEHKFINFVREKTKELFLKDRNMELFVCPAGWINNTKTVLNFKEEDVLIANYEKETVEENIKMLLGLETPS
jgi:hypothetical protein